MTEPDTIAATVRLRPAILAMLFGIVGALLLFGATGLLLIRGGQDVGRHLQLLRHYLPGYRVTWAGACLGLVYGAVIGVTVGYLIARVYNAVAARRDAA